MAEIVLEQVSKVYGGNVVAVDRVDLRVAHREFVVLLGPSGSGKTTILRMIAGLEEPSGGTIRIGRRVVNDVPPKDRDIAMVFQNYALYPHMSVYANMAFGLKLRRFPRNEIDRRVREAARTVGVDGLLGRRPRQLSGGEKQRVALGRAIVRKPAAFLLDEPLANLDATLRGEMRRELSELHRRLDATMLYVTHDQVDAMTLGDRIVVMNSSGIQQADGPVSVYEHPRNRFVAGFIGYPPMNFLDGRIVLKDACLRFEAPEISLALSSDKAHQARGYVGRQVSLGVRPEHVYLRGAWPDLADAESLEGSVELLEPLGDQTIVHLKIGRHSLLSKTQLGSSLHEGERLQVVPDMRRAHIFDRKDGSNVTLQDGRTQS